MPAISQRGQAVPPSPIRKLVPLAEAAVAQGVKVYFLNIGQPDLTPPTEFWDAIHQRQDPMVAYTNSVGNASLRAKVRAAYGARGIELTDQELIVTTAGSEAILFAMMAALNPGDEIIVPEPFYANYNGYSAMAGVKVVPIRTVIEHGFQLPGIEEFASRITPRTRGILICNPNNPTGAVYDRGQLKALRDLCLKHDLYLFSDEVYREFNYTGHEVPSVLELEGMEQHAILLDSVSKRFSLCGARIGFLASRNHELMGAATRMAQARLSPPAIEQIGVEGCMSIDPVYFTHMRDEYQRRRDVLVEGLKKMPGVVVPPIGGAFYAMVRLPIDDCDRFCAWMLTDFRHNMQTVMTAPGTGFYATPGAGRDEVRIAYVLEEGELRKALECLEQALQVYPGRTEAVVSV